MKGHVLCLPTFLAIILLSEATMDRQARKVANYFSAERNLSRSGKVTVQTYAAVLFFPRYTNMKGLLCPVGRHSEHGNPTRVLPMSTTKYDVYDAYLKEWDNFLQSACEFAPGQAMAYPGAHCIPSKTLEKLLSWKKWRERFPFIRESRAGTGYCDTCHSLSESIKGLKKILHLTTFVMLSKNIEKIQQVTLRIMWGALKFAELIRRMKLSILSSTSPSKFFYRHTSSRLAVCILWLGQYSTYSV